MIRIPPSRAGRLRPVGLLVLAALAGCHAPEAAAPAYPLTPAAAVARLQRAETIAFIAAESCGGALDIAVRTDAPGTVTWDVTRGVFHVGSFSVRLDGDGAGGVRPAILIPADPAGGEIYDGGKPLDHPALRQPWRPAVEELVDAALAGRAFAAGRARAGQPVDGMCGGPPAGGTGGEAPITVSGATAAGSGTAAARAAPAAGAPADAPPITVSTLPPDTSGATPGGDRPQYQPEARAPYNPAANGREGKPG